MSTAIQSILLASITISHNPRRPCGLLQDNLAKEGYENYTMLQLIHELALSDDSVKQAEYCRLIETYDGDGQEKSIVSLAKSRAEMEIQPILLRDFRSQLAGVYVTRYGIVAGERRCIAAAYNHAKLGLKPQIGATVRKLTVAQAFHKAVEENAQRREMNDIEFGRIFHNYRLEINPATQTFWTLSEIAVELKMDYQFVRGREALTYLSEAEQSQIDSGKNTNITKAIQKGLGALADCMQLDYHEALEESNDRSPAEVQIPEEV